MAEHWEPDPSGDQRFLIIFTIITSSSPHFTSFSQSNCGKLQIITVKIVVNHCKCWNIMEYPSFETNHYTAHPCNPSPSWQDVSARQVHLTLVFGCHLHLDQPSPGGTLLMSFDIIDIPIPTSPQCLTNFSHTSHIMSYFYRFLGLQLDATDTCSSRRADISWASFPGSRQ